MMAYKTEELEKTALSAIKRHKLIFLDEVISFLPCSAATFYNHKLEELESIKKALEENKIKGKLSSRRKWADSDNATLQIAYYKLLSSEEELRKLTGQFIDHSTGGEKLNEITITIQNPVKPVISEDDIDENIS